MFFVNGAAYANWIARLPEIQTRTSVSLEGLGLILAAAGVTGTIASILAGRAVDRWTSRRVAVWAGAITAGIVPFIGFAMSGVALVVALLVMSVADTLADVAMNVQASQVDAARERPVINRIHGIWSVGTLAGGALASALAGAAVSLPLHLIVVGLVLVAVVSAVNGRLLREDVEDSASPAAGPTTGPRRRLPVSLFVLLAGMGWLAVAIEMIPAEWSTLRLSRDLGSSPGVAGLGFVAFVGGMVVGRLSGDGAMYRFGVKRVMLGGVVLSTVGALVASIVDVPAVVLVGFVVAGLGTSVVFPQLYARSARVPGVRPGRSLGIMSAGIRFGVLVTPIATGAIAQRATVGTAIAILSAVCFVGLVPGIVRVLAVTR